MYDCGHFDYHSNISIHCRSIRCVTFAHRHIHTLSLKHTLFAVCGSSVVCSISFIVIAVSIFPQFCVCFRYPYLSVHNTKSTNVSEQNGFSFLLRSILDGSYHRKTTTFHDRCWLTICPIHVRGTYCAITTTPNPTQWMQNLNVGPPFIH